MKDTIENLKKKRTNMQESLNKIYNVLILKEKQLEKDRELSYNIEGRVAQIDEIIQLLEKDEKK